MNVTSEEIRDILIEEVDGLVDMSTLENNVSLSDQGVDSLDMSNIYLLIEEKYNVKVPDADLDQLTTIDAIVLYLAKK